MSDRQKKEISIDVDPVTVFWIAIALLLVPLILTAFLYQ